MAARDHAVAPGRTEGDGSGHAPDADLVDLYRRERGGLKRSISGIVDPDRAEELVQDSFITYLTKPPHAARPGAWLARVARNRALNDVRRAREVPLTDDRPSDGAGVEARLEREAVRSVVGEALAALPERSRVALRMRFFEERDYADIAQELGVRVEQAHVVMHRALRRLGAEIVKRLAGAHDAEACESALASMAGVVRDGEGHPPGPCDRCSPVWDEIVALRGIQIALPVAGGGMPGVLRRLVEETAVRLPAVTAEPSWLASAALAIGMAVATIASPPAALPPAEGAAPATAQRPAVAAVRRATPPTAAVARQDRPVAGSMPTEEASEPRPKRAVDAGPVSVNQDEGHTQANAQTPGGGTGGGAVVCQPLQPCPPPPPQG